MNEQKIEWSKMIPKWNQYHSKWIQNEQNGTQMAPKWCPKASLEVSKWTRRLQDDSRGTKMASRRFKEVSKMAQRGPKMAPRAHNMIPRGPEMAAKGPKMPPRWAQEGSKGTKIDVKIELCVFLYIYKMLKNHWFFQWKIGPREAWIRHNGWNWHTGALVGDKKSSSQSLEPSWDLLESLYGSWSAPGDSLEGQGSLQRGGRNFNAGKKGASQAQGGVGEGSLG